MEGDCVVSWMLVCGWLVTADTSRSTSDPGFCRFPGYFYMYTRNFFVNIDQTINIIYIIYSVLMIPGLTIAGPNCLPMQRIDFGPIRFWPGQKK